MTNLLDETVEGERLTLTGGGAWVAENAQRLEAQIDAVAQNNRVARRVDIDMGAVAQLDTFGAWLLERLERSFSSRGCDTKVVDLRKTIAH